MGLKLLIIELDDLFRKQISERLRTERYKVFEVALQAEAKGVIQKNNIDVVLLGLRGGQQTGLALLRWIKEFRPLTEVILMTPSEDHSLYASIQAMKLGAFDDLLVPFDMRALLNRIEEAYGRKKEKVLAKRSMIRMKREMAVAGLGNRRLDIAGGIHGNKTHDPMQREKKS